MPAIASSSRRHAAATAGEARSTPAVHTLSVPAYAGPSRLTARIPHGGLVGYRLPALPAGGTRLLGDWDGDGAETPATFNAGVWQLSGHVVRPSGTPLDRRLRPGR